MDDLRAAEHSDSVAGLLARYDFPSTTVQYVDDIQAWCRKNCPRETEDNPFRQAKALWIDGKPLFLIRNHITAAEITSMVLMRRLVGIVKTAKDYLHHLALHEIGHFVTGSTSDEVVDAWVRQKMGAAEPSDGSAASPPSEDEGRKTE